MRIQPSPARSSRVPVWARLAPQISPYCASRHPQFPGDPSERMSLSVALVNLLEPLDAPLAPCAVGLAPRRFRDRFARRLRTRLVVGHAHFHGWNHCRVCHGFRCRLGFFEGRTNDPRLPLEQTFDRLAQILQQMPSIDDLLCLRRCLDGRLSICRPAITTDEFDTGM